MRSCRLPVAGFTLHVSCPDIGRQVLKQNLTHIMAKQQKTTLRYSISFKQKVVKEIEEEGLTFSEACCWIDL